MSKKINISKKTLHRLYWDDHKSSIEIGALLHCHPMTIRNRIRELGIQKRTASDARMRYRKYDFSGDSIIRAYLLGFRLGDLHVYQTSNASELLVVRCHTTQMNQVNLIKNVLSPYGHVSVSKSQYGYNVNAYMNQSFRFLLPKNDRVPTDVLRSKDDQWAFIAGYVDAEGYFGINQGRARFKVDSYDVHILSWIAQVLKKTGLNVKFRRIVTAGKPQSRSGIYHKDLWRLEVNDKLSLKQYIEFVSPYIQHRKRKTDMIRCFDNIIEREDKRK